MKLRPTRSARRALRSYLTAVTFRQYFLAPHKIIRLFNKRIILWVAEKCCRNVTAVRYDRRARRTERVGRSFIGIGFRMQLRRSRTRSPDTREGYRGRLRQLASHLSLYKDPHLFPSQLGCPLCKICSHPLQIFRSSLPIPLQPKP